MEVAYLPIFQLEMENLKNPDKLRKFTAQDVSDYYDQTEVHYRMFWKLEKSLGLHYGVWDENTKSVSDAILNLNRVLAELGGIGKGASVLDAGCGIGGSSIYLAENLACKTVGITLSQKQVDSARLIAQKRGLDQQCQFEKQSYTATSFDDDQFDFAWAIESVGSAPHKADFFKEMHRVLKLGGRILMADTLKPQSYDITGHNDMLDMLNGWAITDILSIQEIKELAVQNGFKVVAEKDVSAQIKKSVKLIYLAGILGWFGTKAYNLFYNASPFSKVHYKTGLAQKKAFDKEKWKYVLLCFEKI